MARMASVAVLVAGTLALCLAIPAGATGRARGAGNVDPTPAIKTVTYNPVV
jgi:hypothetical protein